MNGLSFEQKECITNLQAFSRGELKGLFRECSPPSIKELGGEYDAILLSQGNALLDAIISRAFKLYGNWTGKAFKGIDKSRGYGYNCFLRGHSSTAKLFMDLRIDASSWTSGESMILDYRNRNRGLIRMLEGEVRQVMPGVLLGFGSFGIRLGSRDKLRRRIPFLLYGPTALFRFESDPEQASQTAAAA